jgi:hypothetical protein
MNMTADVAETFVATVPWADLATACPLLDLRNAAGGRYNATGRASMSPATFRLLRGNANPADLWGRRSTAPTWAAATLAELFRGNDLPAPRIDRALPDGRVVLSQEGLPGLTLDVGG